MACCALVIDVRTTEEFDTSHLEDATNVALRALARELAVVPTDSNVISYCGSGHRSVMAVAALHVLETDNVKGYGGSYDSLVESGIPATTT
jgi:rhodanese-related sulfurtransferase